MFGAVVQNVDSVGQDGQNGRQRGLRSGYAAGKVDHQRAADASADGSAEDRGWRMLQAFGAHAFAEAVDGAVADHEGGLRGDVAGRKARPPGRDDKMDLSGVMAQSMRDFADFVRQDGVADGGDAGFLQQPDDSGAGEIGLDAGGAAVADGEDGGLGSG